MALEIPLAAIAAAMDASKTPLSPTELVAEFTRFIGEPYKDSHTRLVLDGGGCVRIHTLVINHDGSESIVRDVALPSEHNTLGAAVQFIMSLG